MSGYKSGEIAKIVKSPYTSFQRAELYAILMALSDFPEPINIVTDSQYAERVVLHIETAELALDNSELTLLFKQLQQVTKNRDHPVYITHIQSHTDLPAPLAQENEEINQLLLGTVLEASEFHKKHHVNSKGLKKKFPSLGNRPNKFKKIALLVLCIIGFLYLVEVTLRTITEIKSGKWMFFILQSLKN